MGGAVERGALAERVRVVLGFGLFLVAYGGGPFGFISGSAQHAITWESLLLVQTSFFLSVVLGCVAMYLLTRRGKSQNHDILGAVGFVATTLLGLALQPVLDGMDGRGLVAVRAVLSLAAGVFYAAPLTFWVKRLHALGKVSSHYGLAGTLMLCYLLCPAVITLCSLTAHIPYRYSVALFVCAVASALIQVSCLRSPQGEPPGPKSAPRPYRLTPYSASLLMCLGFSWGMSDAAAIFGLGTGTSSETSLSVVFAFVPILVVAVTVWMLRGRRDIRFGAIVRLSVVVCGAVLVGLPLIVIELPSLLYPLCNFVMIVGEMALIVFSIDVCIGEGRPVVPVFTLNFALFMGTGCLASALFYAVHALVGGQTAWLVVGIVAVWVVLAVIPFLPSRSSDAIVLMSQTLPENEGYEVNVAMRRDRMVQRYALSEGEAVVLGYLIEGKTREEIAGAMGLSPWTVKARTSSIYKKCGVHSYKELVQLIAGE